MSRGSGPPALLTLTEFMEMAVRTIHQYRVTYLLDGKKKNQGIQSKNPEANMALAEEAMSLLLETHRGSGGSEIGILEIRGLTDKTQRFPVVSVTPEEIPQKDNPLSGLGSILTGNNSPPETTANGLPTLDAVNRMKTDELTEVAKRLGVSTEGMKFPQLRTVVLAGIKTAVKDAA